MKQLSITAQVNALIEQDIEIIVDDVSEEQLLKGLKSGRYATTVSHSIDGGCSMVVDTTDCRHVGNVIYQQELDNSDISGILGADEDI